MLTNPATIDDRPILLVGDSLTWGWGECRRDYFARNALVARGIGGQTTSQIRQRLASTIAETCPRGVHLWCGLNDVLGVQGLIGLDIIEANIAAMLAHTRGAGLPTWLGAVTPTDACFERSHPPPAPRIIALNRRLRRLATAQGAGFIDYHTPLRSWNGGIQPRYTSDGVHLSADGVFTIEDCFSLVLASSKVARPILGVRELAYRCRDALAVRGVS